MARRTEDGGEADAADGERPAGEQSVGQPVPELAELTEERLATHREAAQRGGLPDDDGDRDAVQVAVAHGRRQQLGQEAEAGDAGAHAHHPGHHGQHSGDRDGPVRDRWSVRAAPRRR
jgi:hypothetical protein